MRAAQKAHVPAWCALATRWESPPCDNVGPYLKDGTEVCVPEPRISHGGTQPFPRGTRGERDDFRWNMVNTFILKVVFISVSIKRLKPAYQVHSDMET